MVLLIEIKKHRRQFTSREIRERMCYLGALAICMQLVINDRSGCHLSAPCFAALFLQLQDALCQQQWAALSSSCRLGQAVKVVQSKFAVLSSTSAMDKGLCGLQGCHSGTLSSIPLFLRRKRKKSCFMIWDNPP